MLSYLEPKDGPVIAGEEQHESVYAKDQPQYEPLRALISAAKEGAALSRWSLTVEQRAAIADGADIYLGLLTFHRGLQPILMFVAGDEDADAVKAVIGPIVRRS
jgi:hypothetical protein